MLVPGVLAVESCASLQLLVAILMQLEKRAFAAAGPSSWNSLPNDVRMSDKIFRSCFQDLPVPGFPTVTDIDKQLTSAEKTCLNVARRPCCDSR